MAVHCDGTLTTGTSGEAVCSGNWIDEAASFNDLVLILQEAFSTPEASDIVEAFMAGFTLPVLCYVVSRNYQTVISFIK